MSRNRKNICIIFSPDWQHYAAVETFAIFKTNPAPVKVYLVSDTLGRMDLSEMAKQCGPGYEVEFIDVEQLAKDKINEVNVDGRFTKYTLYRLLLPEIIKEDRLLYVDADAIITADISDFYNMDLGDNIVSGVKDIGNEYYGLKKNIGLKSTDAYINAGVILLDLKKIRSFGLHKKWIELVNTKHFPCHDQDIINLTCKGKIKKADKRYNVSLSTGQAVDIKDMKIIHYAGVPGTRPWENNDPKLAFRQIWDYWEDRYSKEVRTNIPKRIHYAWFGNGPKPPIVQKCMKTWEEILPEYEMFEWNENNFDTNICPFVKDAYKSGKYAFVSDYVMLWALYNYGGVYMDVDVEVLKPFDRFLNHKCFTGHETEELMLAAVIGSVPHQKWIEHLLNYYKTALFEPVPNTQTVTRLSKHLVEKELYGFRYLIDDTVIYPIDYFAAFNHREMKVQPTPNSHALHRFCGSWLGRVHAYSEV